MKLEKGLSALQPKKLDSFITLQKEAIEQHELRTDIEKCDMEFYEEGAVGGSRPRVYYLPPEECMVW